MSPAVGTSVHSSAGPSAVPTLYGDPAGRHPGSFLGLSLRPTLYHCTSCATSNRALRVPRLTRLLESVGAGAERGSRFPRRALERDGPSRVSLASPPRPALLLVPSLSPPLLLLSVFSLRNHPGHRAAAHRRQRARGRERASHKRKACEQAWRRPWGGGASEGGGGLSAGDSRGALAGGRAHGPQARTQLSPGHFQALQRWRNPAS